MFLEDSSKIGLVSGTFELELNRELFLLKKKKYGGINDEYF